MAKEIMGDFIGINILQHIGIIKTTILKLS